MAKTLPVRMIPSSGFGVEIKKTLAVKTKNSRGYKVRISVSLLGPEERNVRVARFIKILEEVARKQRLSQ